MQDDEQQESTAHPPSISSGERGSAAAPPPTEAAAAEAAVAGGPGAQTEGSAEGHYASIQEDGSMQLKPATYRRNFWQGHMSSKFPLMAVVASRLLSAHVTSCATERNWSLFGNIFSKTKNRLALERAKKVAYIGGNSRISVGADEEILPSEIDVLE